MEHFSKSTTLFSRMNICTMQRLRKKRGDLGAKSLYISCGVSNFYGTVIEIWAGFGPVGSTEKMNLLQLWATFEDVFFCFHGQKKIESVHTKNLQYSFFYKKNVRIFIWLKIGCRKEIKCGLSEFQNKKF